MNGKVVIPDAVKVPALKNKTLPKPVIKHSTGKKFKIIKKG